MRRDYGDVREGITGMYKKGLHGCMRRDCRDISEILVMHEKGLQEHIGNITGMYEKGIQGCMRRDYRNI